MNIKVSDITKYDPGIYIYIGVYSLHTTIIDIQIQAQDNHSLSLAIKYHSTSPRLDQTGLILHKLFSLAMFVGSWNLFEDTEIFYF